MPLISGNYCGDAFCILLFLFAIIFVYFRWTLSYWNRKSVYTPSIKISLGNIAKLITQKATFGVIIKNVYEDIKAKGQKYGGYYLFNKPIFVPVDLDLIKQIMTKDFHHFTNHVNYLHEEIDPLSGSLFSLKGQKWKEMRSHLTPIFTCGKTKIMFETLIDRSKDLVSLIDELIDTKDAVDVKEVLTRFTTDSIGACALGVDCGSLKNPQSIFTKYGKKIFSTSLWDTAIRLLSVTVPEFLQSLRLRIVRRDIHDFFINIVEQTINLRKTSNIKNKDFLDTLIEIKNNSDVNQNESSLSLNEITAHSLFFFTAGFENSSATTAFCLYELAQNLEIQNKLRREINDVLKQFDDKITYDAIMKMSYMDKCINETLRKYPLVPVHTRECTETYRVPDSKVILTKGTFVFISTMGIQHDPEYYPDPGKFDPERFSEENKAERHSCAWTPFGAGPRMCIGINFGILQMKVALATLLKNYKFTWHKRTNSALVFDPRLFMLSAKNGVCLNVEKV